MNGGVSEMMPEMFKHLCGNKMFDINESLLSVYNTIPQVQGFELSTIIAVVDKL